MKHIHESTLLLSSFEDGRPPPPRLAARSLVGLDSIFLEWTQDLTNYVASGGSLLRIVSAPSGSGKTHLGEAMKAAAAERGFLVCKIDTQASQTSGDDLQLYRAFCAAITLPMHYLAEEASDIGLRSVLEDVAARMNGDAIRELLRGAQLPVPSMRDTLASIVDAIRAGLLSRDEGWRSLLSAFAGEHFPGGLSLSGHRRRYPAQFGHLRRVPGRRDARLWLESLLLSLRPLGFPGVVLVLDEHDEGRKRALDQSIIQLRHQLDRLAEGHLPGVFVLYLVLDDFHGRIKDHHDALHQRLSPLLPGALSGRLMSDLLMLRDLKDELFLEAVAAKLHELIVGSPLPRRLVADVKTLAKSHRKLVGPDTRSFVKAFARLLEE